MDLLTCMSNLQSVDSTHNLKEASQLLYIDQSTLSKRISRIETHFNSQLISKNEGENTLTDSGHVIVEASKKINALLEELQFELEEITTGTIATSTEHYLRTSLIHIEKERILIENDIDQLIETFNTSDISCLIIEDLYEEKINFSKKTIFSENQLEIVTGRPIETKTIALEHLNNCELIMHQHASYSQTMNLYIKKMQAAGALKADIPITHVSDMQVLLVDLLLNPNKVFLINPGIIIPGYLENKLFKTKVRLPYGSITTYKYFK